MNKPNNRRKSLNSAVSLCLIIHTIARSQCSAGAISLGEQTLLGPGVECGRVPIYQKLYKLSINESFTIEPEGIFADDDDVGSTRILYGLDARAGEWPWIVRLTDCSEGDTCRSCVGTLLNSRWVVSAGHCGYNRTNSKSISADLGLYDLVTPDESWMAIEVDKVIVHPDYDDLNNDLALFRLEQSVEFNDYIQPACLIDRSIRDLISYSKQRPCYAVGYGLTEGMHDAIKLQKLSISAHLPDKCNSDELNNIELRRGTVCVGPNNKKRMGSSCKGDSGGPNLCYDPASNRWHLFGVVSYGPANCDREESDKWLTVSVDLTSYRTWILTTIEANS